MDAALAHLEDQGVLGGLNLREIADRVGVTPANIYHYFGSRRGLLRAALHREMGRLTGAIGEASAMELTAQRLAMFDAITSVPELRLGALLAMDRDPEYEPLPFLDATLAGYQRRIDAGDLPADCDVLALHLLTLATSIGVALYLDPVARQVGEDADALVGRVRAVLALLLDGFGREAPPAPGR